MTLPDRSMMRLAGVHPDLVMVILRAAENTSLPFIVTEGVRTKERQIELVREGKSRTLNSRHLTGHAVDLAVMLPDGGVSWRRESYRFLSMSVKAAGVELAIPVEWGGECFGPTFFDGVHFQLPHQKYPAPVPDLSPPAGGTNVA